MAKAKLLEHKEKAKVNLSLTEKEAFFLHDVLLRIGGDPVKSPRMYANNIRGALEDVNIRGSYADDSLYGAIHYKNGNL